MKVGQRLPGLNTSYELTARHSDFGILNAFPATVEGESEEDLFVYVLPDGVRPEDRERYQKHIRSLDALSAHLQADAPLLNPLHILETVQEPIPFIAAAPQGLPLAEHVVANGPLSELDGLKLAQALLTVLTILHDDFDMILSPAVFDNMHWHDADNSAWLPVWLGMESAPDEASKGWDMMRLGESLHLALLGQEPLRLWGYPLALPGQHESWAYLSYGLHRLLRRLLHPDGNRRLLAGEALASVENMISAWHHPQPPELLPEIEARVERGRGGEHGQVEEAQGLIDILERRDVTLDWTFDALVEETDDLLQHRKAVSGAVNLARGGSFDAALAQLAQAANTDDSNLDLWRWHAVVADEVGAAMLRETASSAQLEALLIDLSGDDMEGAWAGMAAFKQVPQPIEQELTLRTTWQAIVESGRDAATAQLDAVSDILTSIADEGFGQAWDAELGGMSEWRRRAAAFERQSELAEEMPRRVAAISAKRETGDLADAVDRFEVAFSVHPYDASLLDEASELGLACLKAGLPFLARQVFARALSARSERRAQLWLGWRTAQAVALLELSPSLDVTLQACQQAVADLVSVQRDQSERDAAAQLAIGLEGAIVAGLGRVRANDSAAAARALVSLTNEWQRLVAFQQREQGQVDPMMELEAALQRAWAMNQVGVKAQLAKWLHQLELDWPQRASSQPDLSADSNLRQDLEAVRGLFGGIISKTRKGIVDRYGIGDVPAQTQTENKVAGFHTADEIAAGLLSRHFDEIEAALQVQTQWQGGGRERDKLDKLASVAVAALAQHRAAMEQVVAFAEEGDRESAQRKLFEGTRHGQSRSAWEPNDGEWMNTDEWLALLQSSDETESISAALTSTDPLKWARALQSIKKSDARLSDDVKQLAQWRWEDLGQHQEQMETVFSELKRHPTNALTLFDSVTSELQPEHCWNPAQRSWMTHDEMRSVLMPALQPVAD